MTKTEFNDLHDSLCYGHDAELRINGNIVFAEWNGEKMELFHIVDQTGHKICDISGGDRFDTVKMLFGTCIFGKTLQDNHSEIDILDIE